MASPIWAAGTGDWGTAGNWSTPAAIPLDGDAVYFTGQSVVDVTSGLTLGATGDSLVALNVFPDYSGAIGSSGSKLIAAVGITTIRMAARGGKLFVNSAATTDVILEAAGGVTDFFEFAGTATNVSAVGCAGSWSITNGAAITNLEMIASPNCTCTIGTGVTALNRIACVGGGRMVNSSAVSGTTNPGFLEVAGAEYRQEVGAVNQMLVGTAGVVKYNSSGTLTNLIVRPGGVFDGRANRNIAVTITTLAVYPGGVAYLNNTMGSFTVTTNKNKGGTVITQPA